MDINKKLLEFQGQPITHQMLVSVLKDYSRPNDKIKALKDQNILMSVKRGMYVLGNNLSSAKPENSLLANHLYGPSYVSVETALSHYGLIPERVYTVASMTVKPSVSISTPIGLYTYTRLPVPYYAFGLNTEQLGNNQNAIMATPEKALADKIATTPGVMLRSISKAQEYVLDDLRMEISDLKNFNTKEMSAWLGHCPKKESLQFLIKMLERL